jgi:DNA-binding CsgD family transcriptional regulator
VRIYRAKFGCADVLVLSYPIRRPLAFGLLTVTEIDLVDGVLAGVTHAELARARRVSHRTIANQLGSAYKKLGVQSLADLSVMCSEWQSNVAVRDA